LLNDHAEAEDVLQEAFTEAFRHLDNFQYKSSFGAWLKQIVINKAINHLRKKKLALAELNEQVHEAVIEEDPVDETEIEYKITEIKKAIQLLPPGYRAVVSLYLLEGYDHEEISEILGISYSTTRTQYKRAKDKLIALVKSAQK